MVWGGVDIGGRVGGRVDVGMGIAVDETGGVLTWVVPEGVGDSGEEVRVGGGGTAVPVTVEGSTDAEAVGPGLDVTVEGRGDAVVGGDAVDEGGKGAGVEVATRVGGSIPGLGVALIGVVVS